MFRIRHQGPKACCFSLQFVECGNFFLTLQFTRSQCWMIISRKGRKIRAAQLQPNMDCHKGSCPVKSCSIYPVKSGVLGATSCGNSLLERTEPPLFLLQAAPNGARRPGKEQAAVRVFRWPLLPFNFVACQKPRNMYVLYTCDRHIHIHMHTHRVKIY